MRKVGSRIREKITLHGGHLKVCKGGRSIEDSKRPYEFKDEYWNDGDQIVTIGFKMEHSHLVYALETFLIRQLTPDRNFQQKYSR